MISLWNAVLGISISGVAEEFLGGLALLALTSAGALAVTIWRKRQAIKEWAAMTKQIAVREWGYLRQDRPILGMVVATVAWGMAGVSIIVWDTYASSPPFWVQAVTTGWFAAMIAAAMVLRRRRRKDDTTSSLLHGQRQR